jgi:hypothetical protein
MKAADSYPIILSFGSWKSRPLGGIRDRWLCLKKQTLPNSKHEIRNCPSDTPSLAMGPRFQMIQTTSEPSIVIMVLFWTFDIRICFEFRNSARPGPIPLSPTIETRTGIGRRELFSNNFWFGLGQGFRILPRRYSKSCPLSLGQSRAIWTRSKKIKRRSPVQPVVSHISPTTG